MTERDEIAKEALNALISSASISMNLIACLQKATPETLDLHKKLAKLMTPETTALAAYKYADALIAEGREKK